MGLCSFTSLTSPVIIGDTRVWGVTVSAVTSLASKLLSTFQGFPGSSDGKESVHNAGDPASISGLGRSPGEGNGHPLQCSCLEKSMNRVVCQVTVHWITKCQINWHFHFASVALGGKKQPHSFPGKDVLSVPFPDGWLQCGFQAYHLPSFICTLTKSRDQILVCTIPVSFLLTWSYSIQTSTVIMTEHTACTQKRISWVCIRHCKACQLPGSRQPFRDSFMSDTKEESIGGQRVDISFSKKWSIEDQSPSSVYQPWEVTYFF